MWAVCLNFPDPGLWPRFCRRTSTGRNVLQPNGIVVGRNAGGRTERRHPPATFQAGEHFKQASILETHLVPETATEAEDLQYLHLRNRKQSTSPDLEPGLLPRTPRRIDGRATVRPQARRSGRRMWYHIFFTYSKAFHVPDPGKLDTPCQFGASYTLGDCKCR